MKKNSNKLALLLVAIVAIGIFALPSTIAGFSGQHTWYELNNAGNDVPCDKCHQDVYDELESPMNGVHDLLGCEGCHRVADPDITYARDDGAGPQPGIEAHAASTIACMECHEYAGASAVYAGGFTNMTGSPYNYDAGNATGANGTRAAHNEWVQLAVDDENVEMLDSNEACIACHTYVNVSITWESDAFNMTFDQTTGEYDMAAI